MIIRKENGLFKEREVELGIRVATMDKIGAWVHMFHAIN